MPFLNEVNFPVLAANVDPSDEPLLKNASNFYKSTILNVNGVKVAVIGYLTTETKNLTKPNKVIYLDEIKSIKYVYISLTKS